MTKLNIRPATKDDVSTVLKFITDLAIYEKEPDAVEVTTEMLDNVLFADRPQAECVIADYEGKSVGFALYFHNFSTWKGRQGLYLEDLYVDPASRGLGIGKALLIHLGKLAKERGCGRFEWSVLDWNTPAIDFYKSLGARPMDGWTIFRLDGEGLETLASKA